MPIPRLRRGRIASTFIGGGRRKEGGRRRRREEGVVG